MGFFADVYIRYVVQFLVYTFKSLASWLRTRDSANWQSANAGLTSPALAQPGDWGCPTGEIIYTYRYDGELYADIFERPFLLFDSAKEFAVSVRSR